MRALVFVYLLLITGCVRADAQEAQPISVVYYQVCDKLQGVMVAYDDGDYAGFSAEELDANPVLKAALDTLPHKTLHLSTREACGCFS